MNQKSKRKIKIEFGNIKPNFKTNFYTASNERFVEGKTLIAFAKFFEDGSIADKYINVLYQDNFTDVTIIINLDYFTEYKITFI